MALKHKNRTLRPDLPLHLRSQGEKPGTHLLNFSTPTEKELRFHNAIPFNNKQVSKITSNKECQKCSRRQIQELISEQNRELATSLLYGPSWLGDSEWDASAEELREEEQAELQGCARWCWRNGVGGRGGRSKHRIGWMLVSFATGRRCKGTNIGGTNLTRTNV